MKKIVGTKINLECITTQLCILTMLGYLCNLSFRTWCCVGGNHHSVTRQCSLCLSVCYHTQCQTVCWMDLLSSQTGNYTVSTLHYNKKNRYWDWRNV